MKLIVAQLCGAKGHEAITEGAECVRSENAMQFLYHHQLAVSLLLRIANRLVGVSLASR